MRTLILFFFIFNIFSAVKTAAQRVYTTNSVLQTGNFLKIGVTQAGIYKVDIAFLNNNGLSGANISSAAIKLYGNGGQMLSEKNNGFYNDDLIENAIEVVDGGDGIFNNNDYFLFYAPGPNRWLADSTNKLFTYQKNIYSDTAYYFITIGGNGKRINTNNFLGLATQAVSIYNYHYHYENDLVNFLNSGKEWYGEEFSNVSSNNLVRSFTVDVNGLPLSEPVNLITSFAGRSVNSSSTLTLKANGSNISTITIPSNSGNFLDVFAAEVTSQNSFLSTAPNVNLNINFTPANASAQAWLNWFEVHCRTGVIIPSTGQLLFRDWLSVGPSNVATFTISNATNSTSVWDVSNIYQPQKITTVYANNQVAFTNASHTLKEYIAFNNTNYFTPTAIGKIDNQNLHNSSPVDYLIITHTTLINEAKRLAVFHTQQHGYKVMVASTAQIFNEFASGASDPTAIRNFVKMYYDKAGADSTKRPKYLLLFGSASFDYKNRIANNNNLVPCYENNNSINPLATYTSDDFFGLLDDADDIASTTPVSLLDIGIGRIPASTIGEAKIMVDKIINYHNKQSLGAWRNTATFVADDKDNNTHLNDAELISANAAAVNANINKNKIYLDAFNVVSGSSGARYPDVNTAIINQLFSGTLLFNYTGHGGYQRLADEAIFDQDVLSKISNANKLPLFITATCDFAPYDDPTKTSIGGQLLTQNNNGAIALMTTTRLVFAFSNKIINNNYLTIALQPDATGKYLTLGEAVKRAKNFTYQTFADITNNRKFTLLGDPAMRLAFPENKLLITTINNQPITNADTLKALTKYTFGGLVTNANGNALSNFNGTVNAVVFDKPQTITTKGNNPASPVTSFSQQANFLYKGKATVSNGNFYFSCIIPKDINYQVGQGKISLYADDGNTIDAAGYNASFYIGGSSNTSFSDKDGPTVKAYLNDDKFVNGGLTNETPILLLKLKDSSGINTVGTGIGHDITAIVDGDEKNSIKLNDYYEAALNNFQEGQIRYQLATLSEGLHTLKIKAWDVFNNSSEIIIEFTVAKKQQLQISHVYNYPNPFTSKTTFWFEHNKPGENLNVLINIFSVTGKLVHQIKSTINTVGNRSAEIEWDGKDNFSSEKIGRGVYIYRIIVTSNSGKAESTQKLYLL
ncbi:MAG: type IX secretion system sortase PorU [Flavobacterium sp.]|nr:type IX secretion system sortase PorU [Flavobacterium sp.]